MDRPHRTIPAVDSQKPAGTVDSFGDLVASGQAARDELQAKINAIGWPCEDPVGRAHSWAFACARDRLDDVLADVVTVRLVE